MFAKTSTGRKQLYKWCPDDAQAWLQFCPTDKAIQFIVRQYELECKSERHGGYTAEQLRNEMLRQASSQRMQNVNMFSMLSGSMAVQESLQLDASLQAAGEGRDGRNIPISGLQGPSAVSHPWEDMLGDKQSEVSLLSRHVPSDFFLIEGRSVSAMQEILLNSNSFAQIFNQQAQKQSVDLALIEHYRRHLQIDDALLEVLGGPGLDEVAICGSDLYFQQGTDISLLFKFNDRTAQQLLNNHAGQQNAKSIEMGGKEVLEIGSSEENDVLFICNLSPEIHVRSNSLEALRTLIAVSTRDSESLGSSSEFKYVRTLMRWDKKNEDVFVYLSDAFIRKLVGPELRISQHRRSVCEKNLEMINHAILFFSAEHGRLPGSINEIIQWGQCPELGALRSCIDGGEYNLSGPNGNERSLDSLAAHCRVHGKQGAMTPNLNGYARFAAAAEANEYQQFVRVYNQYWRTFFDPIGIQVKCEQDRYVARTIVLPLINSSAYNGLHSLLGASEPEDLASEHQSLPPETIMSFRAKLNKGSLKDHSALLKSSIRSTGSETGEYKQALDELLKDGLGEKVGFHIWDAEPTFSLDISALLGLAAMAGPNAGRLLAASGQFLWLGGLLASLNRPVYASLSLNNPAIVDKFLDILEPMLAKANPVSRGFNAFDYSRLRSKPDLDIHNCSWQIGPAKFRLFFARINKSLYLSTQKSVIESIYLFMRSRSEVGVSISPKGSLEGLVGKAQALFEINHQNWRKVKSDSDLLWLDNSRRACLKNLAPLTVYARAAASIKGTGDLLAGDIVGASTKNPVHQATALCPDGGVYKFDATTGNVFCSVHGGLGQSRQAVQLSVNANAANVLLDSLKRSYASLTFLEDGLHGELVVEKKAPI